MTSLCPFGKYKDIFGKPGTGVHSFKILNTSMSDYIMTLIGAFLLTFISGFPLELSTIFMFALGVILHILFGVPTYTTKYLGLNCLSK
jgi:hypothetical protein